MSQENVEIVRNLLKRYRHLAPEKTPQLAAEFWVSDCDYYPAKGFPEARPCHGREALARYLAEWMDAWDRVEFAINRLIAVSDDRVFTHVTVHADGQRSGVRLDGDLYQCMWMRHGRILRQEDHLTLPGALRGLGLSGDTIEAAGLSE